MVMKVDIDLSLNSQKMPHSSPHGWAMGNLLWVIWIISIVLYQHHMVIILFDILSIFLFTLQVPSGAIQGGILPIYLCPACGRNFRSRFSLKRHVMVKHSGGPQGYNCRHCVRIFYDRQELRRHQEQDHRSLVSEITYSCRIYNFSW